MSIKKYFAFHYGLILIKNVHKNIGHFIHHGTILPSYWANCAFMNYNMAH